MEAHQQIMQDFMDKQRLGKHEKGPLNFGAVPDLSWLSNSGAGVAYLSSTAGAQTYSANALVPR